jgi:hypothetical protein
MTLTLAMFERLLHGQAGWTDITLNFSNPCPTDEELRKSEKYPFGEYAREHCDFTEEEQNNLREDWINLRRAIEEIKAHPGRFAQVAVEKPPMYNTSA